MENTLVRDGNAGAAGSQLLFIALAAVVMAVLAATLVARLTGYSVGTVPESPIIESRELGFRDLPRGVVEVYDWNSEEVIATLAAGEGSFIRGVVRSLVRQRRGLEGAQLSPFVLQRLADGRAVLADPATGESIDLVAFGPTNIAAFLVLLENGDQGSSKPAGGDAW